MKERKFFRKANDKKVIELYNDGLTLSQVAAKEGITAPTVTNVLKRNGITPKSIKERWDAKSDALKEKMLALKPTKKKYLYAKEIADKLQISEITVRRHLIELAEKGNLPKDINPIYRRYSEEK